MHMVEEVHLVSFYERYLESIRQRGFRLLILALVRDADSPSFYEDVRRYWTSLSDVTGYHALFAIAGNGVEQLLSMPTLNERSWTGFSTLVATPGCTTDIDELRQKAEFIRQRLPADNPLFRANTRRPPDAETIAEANTHQVSALAQFLGVAERDIPCLHLTMLGLGTKETALLPISLLGDFSVYTACKEIMRRMQPAFDACSRVPVKDWRDDRELQSRNVVLYRAEAGLRRFSRGPGLSAGAVRAEKAVATARKAVEERKATLRSEAMQAEALAMQAKALAEARAAAEFHNLRAALGEYSVEGQWDFFISYPTPKRELAKLLFRALEPVGKTFLDCFCLRHGDDWHSRLGAVQAGCHTTIVLISKHTDRAHFQLSEIHRAINLMRRSKHRVLPVYTSKGISAPFGLEQIHGILPASSKSADLISAVIKSISSAQTCG